MFFVRQKLNIEQIYINVRFQRIDILMNTSILKMCAQFLLFTAACSILVKEKRFWAAHMRKMFVMPRDV